MMMVLTGKIGALTGKKAIGIIFLIVGIMLMFFIISQSTGIYKTSRESSDRQGRVSLQCVGYLYSISGVVISDGELQFSFRNELGSTEDVHNLTVADSSGREQGFSVSIPAGSSYSVRVPVAVADNFSVYPDSCNVFPARCSLEGECTYK